MRNTGLEEAQAGIKITGRNINNLRYADDTTLMAESQEELKCLLMKVKLLSHVWLFATLWTVARQAPLSMGFSRQESRSGLPFPSPGDLLNPGIETRSPALQADALSSEPPGKQCKSRKSRNTWSNGQIWPWSTEWSRTKAKRVLPRECTGHSKHPLSTTQEKTPHMDITRWSIPKSD